MSENQEPEEKPLSQEELEKLVQDLGAYIISMSRRITKRILIDKIYPSKEELEEQKQLDKQLKYLSKMCNPKKGKSPSDLINIKLDEIIKNIKQETSSMGTIVRDLKD